MQIYFHSRLCSYLPRVPILVEGTVVVAILLSVVFILIGNYSECMYRDVFGIKKKSSRGTCF